MQNKGAICIDRCDYTTKQQTEHITFNDNHSIASVQREKSEMNSYENKPKERSSDNNKYK